MDEFTGKIAVVTGAASGIGLGIVRRFARDGMRVVLADVEEPALDAAVKELREAGADAEGVVTDVSDLASVKALRQAVIDQYGPADVVVSNAGVEGYMDGHLWEATDADWEWTLGVNYGGAQNMVRTFVPDMAERDDGYFVITASIVSAWTSGGLYGISKHAVLALAEAVYSDLAGSGSKVGVSVLMPGGTATNLFTGSRNRPARLRDGADPTTGRGAQVRRHMAELVANATQPSEVADTLVAAMRARQFYVLTGDDHFDDRVRERTDNIINQANPQLKPIGAPPAGE